MCSSNNNNNNDHNHNNHNNNNKIFFQGKIQSGKPVFHSSPDKKGNK